MKHHITSKDGTTIAYDREGSGPAVILVTGALDDHSELAPLMPELADQFTVYNYARRGRGGSGDTQPYTLEREFEDLEALVAAAGGPAHAFGASSGGALVLEAAAAGVPFDRIVLYEVPYMVDEDARQRWQEYVQQLGSVLAEGRRGDAVELFMRMAGATEEMVASARNLPVWPGLEAVAPTLAYDAACLGDGEPPTARLVTVTQPTLVATGGGEDFFEQAADVIAASVPQSERLVVEGAGHMVDASLLAPVLQRFFSQ